MSKGILEGMIRQKSVRRLPERKLGAYRVLQDLTLTISLIPSPIFLSLSLYPPAPLDLFLFLPQAFVFPIHSAWTTLSWILARLPLLFIQILAQMSTAPAPSVLKFCFVFPWHLTELEIFLTNLTYLHH